MNKRKVLKWGLIIIVLIMLGIRLNYRIQYNYPEFTQLPPPQLLKQPDDITCGPTSAAMLLSNYYKINDDRTPENIASIAKTHWFYSKGKAIGLTSPDYLTKAIVQLGLPVKRQINCTIDDLKQSIADCKPAIVLLRSGPALWHYVVVFGYESDEIIFADPSDGDIHTLPMATFVGAWDFTKDMDGHEMRTKCHCNNGRWNIPGPLGNCEICGGTGYLKDKWSTLVNLADVVPGTMIVPNKSYSEMERDGSLLSNK